MQESVGYSVTINIIITFIIILFAFISAALIYFKSNKVGNIITESIEKYSGLNGLAENEISVKLASIGYNRKKLSSCKQSIDGCSRIKYSNDGYCVYLCAVDADNTARDDEHKLTECDEYYYYKIKTNMFINIPIINNIVELPIYSETNRMYNFEYDPKSDRCK